MLNAFGSKKADCERLGFLPCNFAVITLFEYVIFFPIMSSFLA